MNISTYLTDQELSELTELANSKYISKSALIKQTLANFPTDLNLVKITDTNFKNHVSFNVQEENLLDRLELEKMRTGKTKSVILYSLILKILQDRFNYQAWIILDTLRLIIEWLRHSVSSNIKENLIQISLSNNL